MGCYRGRFEARRLLPLALLVASCGADLTKIAGCAWEETSTQECDSNCLDMGTGSGSREACREGLYENDGVPDCGGRSMYYNSNDDSCYVCDGDGTSGTLFTRHTIDYCSEITACADGWQPSADGQDCDPVPTPRPTLQPVAPPTAAPVATATSAPTPGAQAAPARRDARRRADDRTGRRTGAPTAAANASFVAAAGASCAALVARELRCDSERASEGTSHASADACAAAAANDTACAGSSYIQWSDARNAASGCSCCDGDIYDILASGRNGTGWEVHEITCAAETPAPGAAGGDELPNVAASFGCAQVTRVVASSLPSTYAILASDVDGDGDVDLVATSASDRSVAVYNNDGSQGFTENVISDNPAGAYGLDVGDVDGDGDADAFVAFPTADAVVWYEQDSNLTDWEHVATTAPDSPRDVFAADVDGDADLDVVVASALDDTVAWFENDGSQSFSQRVVAADAVGACAVGVVDVDGDGDLDLVAASRNDDAVRVYSNDGAQSFLAIVVSTHSMKARDVFAADVDGDADADLLVSSSEDRKLEWFENLSPGVANHTLSRDVSGASGVYAADVDGDGAVDLLVAAEKGDVAYAFLNNGTNFPMYEAGGCEGTRSIHAADIDGDGDVDGTTSCTEFCSYGSMSYSSSNGAESCTCGSGKCCSDANPEECATPDDAYGYGYSSRQDYGYGAYYSNRQDDGAYGYDTPYIYGNSNRQDDGTYGYDTPYIYDDYDGAYGYGYSNPTIPPTAESYSYSYSYSYSASSYSVAPSPYPTYLSQALVAHYSFDDGTAADDANKVPLDGTIVGATATTGRDGSGALSFDGVDDYVVFPAAVTANLLGNASRTVCLWALIDEFDEGTLFSYDSNVVGQRFGFMTESAPGEFRLLGYGSSYDFPDLALSGSDDGDWHHICNTYNGTRWVLYFDGDEKHSVKVDLETGDDNPLTIGVRYSSGYTGYFSGSIDEVSVYSRALDEGGIRTLYSAFTIAPTAAPTPSALIVHYSSFDDGTANGHHDGSLDGTIVGASATTGPDGSGALSFDGVDDYVEFPSAVTADILGGSARTICLWANFALRVAGTDGSLKVQLWGADTDVALSGSDDGGWHHYCLTYDGSTWYLYFDGNEAGSGTSAVNTGSDRALRLGQWNLGDDNEGYLDGSIDEVYVYSTALDADDVEALYAAAAAPPTGAPTVEPTAVLTAEPSLAPSPEPSTAPTVEPTAALTAEPSLAPSPEPSTATPSTAAPSTAAPSAEPTMLPSAESVGAPSLPPTLNPSSAPPSSALTVFDCDRFVVPAAPVLADAAFTSTGAKMLVNLDSASDLGGFDAGEEFACDEVLAFDDAALATCFWVNGTQIDAVVSSSVGFEPGDAVGPRGHGRGARDDEGPVLRLEYINYDGFAGFVAELVVANFLGGTANKTTRVEVTNKAIPSLEIIGGSERTTLRSQSLSVEASGLAASCDPDTPVSKRGLTYAWTLYALSGGVATPQTGAQYASTAVNERFYTLGGYTLDTNRDYALVANASDSSGNYNVAGTRVSVGVGAVVAVIDGGDRVVSTSSAATVDASSSYDEDGQAALTYAWSCADANGSSCDAFLAGTLGIDLTADAASVTLTFVPETPPTVTIDAPATVVNPQQKLTLSSAITAPATDDVGAPIADGAALVSRWTLVAGALQGARSLANVTRTALDASVLTTASGATTHDLVFAAYSLVDGATYTLSLSATVDGVATRGAASVTIVAATPPTSGVCRVANPETGDATGEALVTKFSIETSLWASENLPLNYKFEYASSGGDAILRGASLLPTIASYLPQGTITVSAIAVDAVGATGSASETATVTEFVAASTEALLDASSVALDEAFAEASLSAVLQAVVSSSGATSTSDSALDASLIGYLANATATLANVDSGDVEATLATLVYPLANAGALDDKASATALATVGALVASMVSATLGGESTAPASTATVLSSLIDSPLFSDAATRRRRLDEGEADDDASFLSSVDGLGTAQLAELIAGEDAAGVASSNFNSALQKLASSSQEASTTTVAAPGVNATATLTLNEGDAFSVALNGSRAADLSTLAATSDTLRPNATRETTLLECFCDEPGDFNYTCANNFTVAYACDGTPASQNFTCPGPGTGCAAVADDGSEPPCETATDGAGNVVCTCAVTVSEPAEVATVDADVGESIGAYTESFVPAINLAKARTMIIILAVLFAIFAVLEVCCTYLDAIKFPRPRDAGAPAAPDGAAAPPPGADAEPGSPNAAAFVDTVLSVHAAASDYAGRATTYAQSVFYVALAAARGGGGADAFDETGDDHPRRHPHHHRHHSETDSFYYGGAAEENEASAPLSPPPKSVEHAQRALDAALARASPHRHHHHHHKDSPKAIDFDGSPKSLAIHFDGVLELPNALVGEEAAGADAQAWPDLPNILDIPHELAEAFDFIDKDHNGALTRAEVIRACRRSAKVRDLLGLPEHIRQEDGTRDRFEEVFQALDVDDSKTINLLEFCALSGVLAEAHGGTPRRHDPRTRSPSSARSSGARARALLPELLDDVESPKHLEPPSPALSAYATPRGVRTRPARSRGRRP
ncbi:hypothetical protein JL722_6442 [Aureococcus anophagefferens]|nr:hypothetical protein JL722_6442 [Aureococcus anophagefferens]